MITVRCKRCGREITAQPTKTQCCGCPNMMTVTEDKITAEDLSLVLLLNGKEKVKNTGFLTETDLKYQEARRQRRVRKLNFEVR